MSSFCCGASKVGSVSSVFYNDLLVHQVPILYCPVCKDVEIHPKIKGRVEMLINHAKSNGFQELFCQGKLNVHHYDDLFEDCSTIDYGKKGKITHSQIDIALDLLSFAQDIQDKEWEICLKKRLSELSKKDVTKNI